MSALAVGSAAPVAAAPFVEVVPNADIVNDQVVTVQWRGFASGPMQVRVCKSIVFDVQRDCTRSFGGSSDDNGIGRIQLRLSVGEYEAAATDRSATPPVIVQFSCGADDPCAIRVDSQVHSEPQLVPIHFAASTRPRRTCKDATPALLLRGVGSAGMADAFERWIRDLCQTPPYGIAVDYSPRSSSEGRQSYINGAATGIDFGVTAEPLTPEEVQRAAAKGRGKFVYIPIAASAVAITSNAWHRAVDHEQLNRTTFVQIRELCLTPESAVRILTGQLTYLYDANDSILGSVLVADNPVLDAIKDDPRRPLQVSVSAVARADESSSTYWLTSWFQSEPGGVSAWHDAGPEFAAVDVTHVYPSSGRIDGRSGGLTAMRQVKLPPDRNEVNALLPRNAMFGWGDLSLLRSFGLPAAALKDMTTGECIAPTPESVTQGIAAMAVNADGVTRRPAVVASPDGSTPAGTNPPNAYPMPILYYMIVPTEGLEPEKVAPMKSLVEYILGFGQQGLSELGYVPLPPDVLAVALEQVALLGRAGDGASAPASAGGSITGGGTFDVPSFAASQPVAPGATANANSAGRTDDQVQDTQSDFVRFVTAPGTLVVLLLVLGGLAAFVAGPILRWRAEHFGP